MAKAVHDVPDVAGVGDDRLRRLGFWRSVTGLATVALLGLAFGKDVEDVAISAPGGDPITNAVIALIVVVVCAVAIYPLTRRGRRHTLWPGTLRMLRNLLLVAVMIVLPLVAVGLLFPHVETVPFLPWLVIVLCGPLCGVAVARARDPRRPARTPVLVVLGLVAAGLVVLTVLDVPANSTAEALVRVVVGGLVSAWWFVYIFAAFYWMARTVMWSGEIHPLLAPIGTALVVTTAFVSKLVDYRPHEVPFGFWGLVTVSGFVTTMVLAVLEYRGLRHLGFRLRSGADVPAGVVVKPMPVSIYLGDGAGHAEVETAVERALRASGLAVIDRDNPITGSWFRRLRAKAADAGASELGATVAHAAETHLVLAQDAEVTARLMEHLAPVIESLRAERDVVLRIGAVLIVKTDGMLSVVQLTPAQQYRLNHEPQLARQPEAVLRVLAVREDRPAVESQALLDAPPRSSTDVE